MLEHQNEHLCETSLHFTIRSVKIDVFPRVFLRTDIKIDVSYEASVDFHHMSSKFHACHGICTLSPLRAELTMGCAKIRKTTHLKCCGCHANDIGGLPKCCAYHEKCNASSENVAKVLRLHTKRLVTRRETCWGVTKCHACHAKWSDATLESSKVTPFAEPIFIGTAIWSSRGRMRTVADGCERLSNVPRTQLNPHTPRVKREPSLRIREKVEIDGNWTWPISFIGIQLLHIGVPQGLRFYPRFRYQQSTPPPHRWALAAHQWGAMLGGFEKQLQQEKRMAKWLNTRFCSWFHHNLQVCIS